MDVLFVTEITPRKKHLGKYSYPWHELAMDVSHRGFDVSVCAPVRLLAPQILLRTILSIGGPLAYSPRMRPSIIESFHAKSKKIGGLDTFILDRRVYRKRITELCMSAKIVQFSSVKDFLSCYRIMGENIFGLTYVMHPMMSCMRLRPKMGDVWNRMFGQAAYTVYPSQAAAKVLANESLDHKHGVIPYGVNSIWYEVPTTPKDQRKDGTVLIVSACGLIKYKGVDRLLDAVAPLRNVKLEVIGEGPYRVALEEQASKICRPGQVEFTGWLSAREMMPHIDACDIFILPCANITESLGLVYLEALARRRPILGVVDRGVHGMFPDCHNALFLPQAFTSDDLKNGIEKLVALRPFDSCTCGQCTRKFDRETVADEFSRVYRGILETGNGEIS